MLILQDVKMIRSDLNANPECLLILFQALETIVRMLTTASVVIITMNVWNVILVLICLLNDQNTLSI
jgi:hypothetical protein